jgi:hypothetical protein
MNFVPSQIFLNILPTSTPPNLYAQVFFSAGELKKSKHRWSGETDVFDRRGGNLLVSPRGIITITVYG